MDGACLFHFPHYFIDLSIDNYIIPIQWGKNP